MKTFLLPLVFVCLLSACTSLSGSRADGASQYRERDLTVNWYARSYWCVPDRRAPHPVRKTASGQ